MIRFACDYAEGCHPRILKALTQTNLEQTVGYGCDPYCETARTLLQKATQAPADIHFLVGGTQANLTVIAAVLRAHQGVLCAETGHLNVHETGAPEATGHKVLPLPATDGKITAEQVENAVNAHYADASYEHTVQPGMVYISHPTECGTLYTKRELTDLFRVCREYHLPLYIDGARLAYALTAKDNDLSLPEIARLCDILCVGGTKCGALFGEAVMIFDPALKPDFRYLIKQRGGMLAKGRLLGLQFLTLFTEDLYTEISAQANRYADTVRDALKRAGIPLAFPTTANQTFAVMTDEQLSFLKDKYMFETWGKPDEEHTVIRICTSWATTQEQIDELTESILALR